MTHFPTLARSRQLTTIWCMNFTLFQLKWLMDQFDARVCAVFENIFVDNSCVRVFWGHPQIEKLIYNFKNHLSINYLLCAKISSCDLFLIRRLKLSRSHTHNYKIRIAHTKKWFFFWQFVWIIQKLVIIMDYIIFCEYKLQLLLILSAMESSAINVLMSNRWRLLWADIDAKRRRSVAGMSVCEKFNFHGQ